MCASRNIPRALPRPSDVHPIPHSGAGAADRTQALRLCPPKHRTGSRGRRRFPPPFVASIRAQIPDCSLRFLHPPSPCHRRGRSAPTGCPAVRVQGQRCSACEWRALFERLLPHEEDRASGRRCHVNARPFGGNCVTKAGAGPGNSRRPWVASTGPRARSTLRRAAATR